MKQKQDKEAIYSPSSHPVHQHTLIRWRILRPVTQGMGMMMGTLLPQTMEAETLGVFLLSVI